MKGSWPEKIIAIVGPTASGKTDMARSIAKKLGGFLISVDARQIYKGMDIGTNKDPIDVIYNDKTIEGFGLDLVDPDETYTAQQFQAYVYEILKNPPKEGLVPILVGGTGLWVQAIIDGLQFPQVPPNDALRTELEERVQNEGIEEVAKELLVKDPNIEGMIDMNNPRRVIRALEIIEGTGELFSKQRKKNPPPFQTCILMPDVSREKLDERIEKRAHGMLEEGLISEVQALLQRYPQDLPAFSAIGYVETIDFLQGKTTKDELRRHITAHTRQYARRQMSWWRREKKVIPVTSTHEAITIAGRFIGKGTEGMEGS